MYDFVKDLDRLDKIKVGQVCSVPCKATFYDTAAGTFMVRNGVVYEYVPPTSKRAGKRIFREVKIERLE